MTGRRALLAILGMLALSGCDKRYCAVSSVEAPPTSTTSTEAMASDLMHTLERELSLECTPDELTPNPRGDDQSSDCDATQGSLHVEVYVSGTTIRVRSRRLGGFSEPADFAKTRTTIEREMRRRFPRGDVRAEYPCPPDQD